MYKVTAKDRMLVDEFRQQPIGSHSPDLQRMLNAMRGAPTAAKSPLKDTAVPK